MTKGKAALLGLYGLCATPAWAQSPSHPTSEAHPLVAELHTGFNDPLGRLGLAMVYDAGGRLSAGLGLGFDSVDDGLLPKVSLFGRVRLLRVGNLMLDAGAILSRGGYQTSRSYTPPKAAGSDELTWIWAPDYRATGTLAAGMAGRRWALRVETGLAYHFGRPTCDYVGSGSAFRGDCRSEYIPSEYHFSREPGRISASLSLTLGYRLGVEDEPAASPAHASPDYRSPVTAQRLSGWSTAIPVLLGATVLSLGSDLHSNNVMIVGIGMMGLGLSFGPSIGYAYAGEPMRAWGLGLLRAVGIGISSAVIYMGAKSRGCDECGGTGSLGEALGITLMLAPLISAANDILVVPKAAVRANARHGLGALSLMPVPLVGPKSVGAGIALGGPF